MTAAAYDEIADWYNALVQEGVLFHYFELIIPHLFELMGDVEGKDVCDLACGQGVLSRQLARRGAKVVGVDLSEKMLEFARHEEETEPLGIVYMQDDAQMLTKLGEQSFDGVLCNLGLTDIPDVKAAFQSVQRILRPEGWFVFSINHPCFLPPNSGWVTETGGTVYRAVRSYFDEIFWRSDNPHGVRGKVGAHHRTLSTYVNSLIDAGLGVECLLEPQGGGEIAERVPGYREVPVLLLVLCRKT